MSEFLTLKKSNCKNCYKCIRNCPVKAIRFSGGHAHIVANECILCGHCYVVCPQDAKRITDETESVGVLLNGSAPVYASVAPSFIAYFEGVGIGALREAIKKLGFADAEETAVGATFVKREYEKLAEAGEQDIILTSCCHSVNLLIEKYYPELAPFLAPVVTPMKAHCDDIKRRRPGAKTVFIGPCISKKDEGASEGVDAVLTFDELAAMFAKAGIVPEKRRDTNAESRARLFPTTGGILRTLGKEEPSYTYLTVSGIENCKAVLDDIASGNVHRCFIEMSSCSGSCIDGPIMEKYRNAPVRHYKAVNDYAGADDYGVPQPDEKALTKYYAGAGLIEPTPSESEITAILKKMGKISPADELNCGTCGYDTCREKAVAIFRGKAEISMCLPYLMEKSECFSTNILDNSPNGILVLNDALEVQEINPSAMKMLRIKYRTDVLGEPVVRILDPTPFLDVLEKKRQIRNKREYFAEYDKYLEQTIILDNTSGGLIAILRDVTDEENEKRIKDELCRQTAETADKVVDKQMRIVQEIASLLGETAAETKIALTKLKESLSHYEDN